MIAGLVIGCGPGSPVFAIGAGFFGGDPLFRGAFQDCAQVKRQIFLFPSPETFKAVLQ